MVPHVCRASRASTHRTRPTERAPLLSQGWQCPWRGGEPVARRAGPAGSRRRRAGGRRPALAQRPPGDVAPGAAWTWLAKAPGASGQQRGGKLSSALGQHSRRTRHWQRLHFQWQRWHSRHRELLPGPLQRLAVAASLSCCRRAGALQVQAGATSVGSCCEDFEDIFLLHLQDIRGSGLCESFP